MGDEGKPVAWQWTAKGDRNRFRRLSNVVMWPQGDVVEVQALAPATTLATLQAKLDEKDVEIGRLKAIARAFEGGLVDRPPLAQPMPLATVEVVGRKTPNGS